MLVVVGFGGWQLVVALAVVAVVAVVGGCYRCLSLATYEF